MTHAQATELIAPSGLLAAVREDMAAVQAIIEAQPALIEAMNALTPKTGEETPQRVAAYRRQLPILQYLRERGVQPDLFMACALGLTDIVEAYLTAHPTEVDAKGAHGVPLIFHANDPAMVELLLRLGADPTLALVQLTWSGRTELMQIAMKRGAQIDSPKLGRRPLHIAAAQGHVAAVEMLLAAGADVESRAKGAEWEFKTALALATMKGHTAVIEVLRKLVKPRPVPMRRGFAPRSPRRFTR